MEKIKRIDEKLYRCVYKSMKSRCLTKTNKEYHNYGARGIRVCPSWLKDYDRFRKWAMKNGYKEGVILDRENGNGNYSPQNCRFVTPKVSTRNTRVARTWHIKGMVFEAISDASKKLKVSVGCIQHWVKTRDDCWSELKYKGAT